MFGAGPVFCGCSGAIVGWFVGIGGIGGADIVCIEALLWNANGIVGTGG